MFELSCLICLRIQSCLKGTYDIATIVNLLIDYKTALSDMLTAFLSGETLNKLHSAFSNLKCHELERLDTILFLSTPACDAVEEGEVLFTVQTWGEHPDTTIMQTVSCFSLISFIQVLKTSSIW